MDIVVVFAWFVLALYGIKKHNATSIGILIIMIIFQNFILIVTARYMTRITYNVFVITKEIYVCVLIAIKYIQKPKLSRIDLGCICAIGIIVLYALIKNSESFMGTLVSVRQLYLPFLFLLLGILYFKSEKELENSISFFVKIMVLCVIFGWIEMVFGASFWLKLGYANYAKLKSIESGLTNTGISGAFYSWDLGFRIRRMGSFLAEPVILGQLFSMALIMSIFMRSVFTKKGRLNIYAFLLALGLLSTLAKGGIIIALFSFTFVLGKIWREKRFSFILKLLFLAIIIGGFAYTFSAGRNGATHVKALIDNLRYLPHFPLGRGIGTVGNLGYNYGGRGELLVNGESFIGAAIGQMGIFAVLLYGWFYRGLFEMLRQCSKNSLYSIGNIITWLNGGLLLTALINNTAISFTSCFCYYIYAGAVYGIYRNNRYAVNLKGRCNEKIQNRVNNLSQCI